MVARISSLRARLDVDERREQLLRLGLELFGQRSYESISIKDIAEAGSISRSLLYHYFRNKRGFYVECVRFAAAKLHEAIEPDPEDPPHERVRRGLESYLDFVGGFAKAYAAILRSGIGYDPEVTEIVEGTRRAIIGDIIDNIGAFADQELVRVALRGWLGMVEFSCLEWLERRSVGKQELIELLIGTLETTLERATGVGMAEILARGRAG